MEKQSVAKSSRSGGKSSGLKSRRGTGVSRPPKTRGADAKAKPGATQGGNGKPKVPAKRGARARRSKRLHAWFPEIAWLHWLVPRRRRPLFKTKLAIVVLAALIVGRIAWVHFHYSLEISNLKAAGYVLDESYDIPFCHRWVHATDFESAPVTFFRYPRPEDSLMEKISTRMMDAYLDRHGTWMAEPILAARVAFMKATAPFLTPVDSRTGFDPYSEENVEEAKEDLLRKLLQPEQ